MATIETAVIIDRPVDEVFAFVADLSRYPEWSSGVLEVVKNSHEPVGPGASFKMAGSFLGQRIEGAGKVTEYEPGKSFSFEASSPFPFVYRYSVQPHGGGTRLRLFFELRPNGFFLLMEQMVVSVARRQVEGDLQSLKALMEGKRPFPTDGRSQ